MDPFAIEIARLSLTLTDIPNPNGWNLKQGDVFASNALETAASCSRILLANPPFEKIEPAQRATYTRQFQAPRFVNKAAEMLYRCVSSMPDGGVFGLVVPQNLLHSNDAADFRRMLVDQSEFEEICLFPDKVFNFADVESAILIGRKTVLRSDRRRPVRYRRVRDNEIEWFRSAYGVTSEVMVPITRFSEGETCDLRVPDLEEIWAACAHLPKLQEFVEIGQGFSFIGEDQPNFPKGQQRTSPVPREGFKEGFENLGDNVMTHQVPPTAFLNLSDEIILRPRSGTAVGVPQVLVNEARMQRAPWCAKAMLDLAGHPATSRFTLFRPRASCVKLKLLWAVVNSPFANAFAFSNMASWSLLTGTWRQMPFPSLMTLDTDRLGSAIENYLFAVDVSEHTFSLASDEDRLAELEALKVLHWRIDAEVLKLYALPVEFERKLLDYFAGCKRVGVPFHQDRYFPEGFDVPVSLADYLAITADWEATNARRLELIERKLGSGLTTGEQAELKNLKRLASARSALVLPLPTRELAEQEAELRTRGQWKGA